jgi:hypothetical protein
MEGTYSMKSTIIASVVIFILATVMNADEDKWKKYNKHLTIDEVSYTDWQQNDQITERTITIKAHTATVNYTANCGEDISLTTSKYTIICPSVEVDDVYDVNIENGAICFIPADKDRDLTASPIWACYSVTKASRRSNSK